MDLLTVRTVFSAFIVRSGVAGVIWNEYLPKALAEGKILPKSDPVVVRTGLEGIQTGLDKCKEGYSAAKIIVRI